MPEEFYRRRDALNKAGRAKGFKGKRLKRWTYGILRHKFGWKPEREKR